MDSPLRHPKSGREAAVAAVPAAALIAMSVALSLAYWPGVMTWDSVRQYDQALNGGMDDWHPPLMEWIWSRFIPLHPGPAPMLLLQLGLSAAGYGLLSAWAIRLGRRGLAVALAACSLMPLAVALMGVILKDCLMSGALLGACGLLAWIGLTGDWRRDWPLRLLALALIGLAAGVRFNAFLADVPLVVALIGQAAWRTPLRLAAASLVATAGLMTVLPVVNHLIGAQRSGVELSLVIFDLGGITEHSGVDAFPPLGVANPVAVSDGCYSPIKWDTYAPWTDTICPIGFDPIRAYFAKAGGSPWVFLAKAVLAHPVAYVEHRLSHWNINSRFLVRGEPDRPVPNVTVDNDWGFHVGQNPVLRGVDAAARLSALTPLGWPCFWMALAIGVLLASPALPSRGIIAPVALSALLYGLGYGVFSVSSELRYYLWTYIATALATVIAGADMIAVRGFLTWRRYALFAAPPLAVALVGALWRLMPG